MKTSRTFFVFISLWLLFLFKCVAQDANKDNTKPFGPVVKFDGLSFAHHYSKILLGIEYFISERISFQHKIGPVVSIDNYSFFKTSNYNSFYGGSFDNDVRYYFYHNYKDVFEYETDYTIKGLYVGLEMNYNYTFIDTYIVEEHQCAGDDLCYYYEKIDTNYERNRAAIGLKSGVQFIFENNLSLDLNAGLGYGRVWVKNNYQPPPGVYANEQISFPTEEYNHYLIINVLIGYSF